MKISTAINGSKEQNRGLIFKFFCTKHTVNPNSCGWGVKKIEITRNRWLIFKSQSKDQSPIQTINRCIHCNEMWNGSTKTQIEKTIWNPKLESRSQFKQNRNRKLKLCVYIPPYKCTSLPRRVLFNLDLTLGFDVFLCTLVYMYWCDKHPKMLYFISQEPLGSSLLLPKLC